MNAEGGDDPDYITENFFYLIRDARRRRMLCDRYYYLSDELMDRSKHWQGIERSLVPEGTRIEQAFFLWRQCPRQLYQAVMAANGGSLVPPFDEGVTITLKHDGTYVTLVDVGENFDIENRGSMTMVFEPERDPSEIVRTITRLMAAWPIRVKDLRQG